MELNKKQLEQVLETIASQTETLRSLIFRAADSDEPSLFLDAAAAIATNIGVMADGATGFSVVADRDSWHYGPNFAAAGKEVQHG